MPTAANEGKWRPTKNRYVFVCTVHFIFYFLITTKPTKAHSSQRRPTQVNTCPQQATKANGGPQRIGMFFFCTVHFIFYFLTTTKPTKAHSSQRRPTRVNVGPQHPTKVNAGPRRRKRDRNVFFWNVHFIFHFLITTKPTKAHSSQRRPTQVNAGPQHPTKVNAGPRRRKRDRSVFLGSVVIVFSFL